MSAAEVHPLPDDEESDEVEYAVVKEEHTELP